MLGAGGGGAASKEEREKAKRACYGIIYGELIFVIGILSLSWECRDAVWMCYSIIYGELSCCTIYGELCLCCGEHCPGLQRCFWGVLRHRQWISCGIIYGELAC